MHGLVNGMTYIETNIDGGGENENKKERNIMELT
jgi:hypothetical protein